ncbi:3-methyladenine DNA glycosylase [Ereboglobus luteus]|uniref:Putative 3-methyladenine DNA glycosylase n=2 Tax=Ereboglobus luteus TaxID=1796921 RepID=A0A2U8E246_9BACT|nr:3-methyladenine DNA glycosylase [Ereboglobus luteus]
MSPEALRCKNTVALARRLIGKTLARRLPGGETQRAIITETEAYHGETDLACHASKGRTARTDVMYRAGGVWYVYLCYGVHEMLNLVTGPEDFPSAILIRAAGGVTGPGRLTKALKINRALNGASACDPAGGLWIEDAPGVPKKQILITPRIGIDYAGPVWSAKPWRFVLKGNKPEK